MFKSNFRTSMSSLSARKIISGTSTVPGNLVFWGTEQVFFGAEPVYFGA